MANGRAPDRSGAHQSAIFEVQAALVPLGDAALSKGCRCEITHIKDVIARFPDEERKEMADEAGVINVNCEFCAKNFAISSR